MPFKYINPGYPRLYGCDYDAQNGNVNPINGIYRLSGNMCGEIEFPSDCDEIWAKADFYKQNNNWYLEFGVGNRVAYGTVRSTSTCFYGFENSESTPRAVAGAAPISLTNIDAMQAGRQYSVMIHSKNGEDGFLVIYLDGRAIYTYNGNVTWAAHKIALKNSNGNASIHNIIVSDEPIGFTEQVYVVPAKTTETTMTESNGVYTATEANQTLKQTIDTDALVTKVGLSNIKVTGVGFLSRASFDGEGLTKLGILNGNTEVSESSLSTVANEYASSWKTDMTIAELATIKVGCVAKE